MSSFREQRRELLIKVYGTAVDEYRFNVQLNWDRTKFFLGLTSTGTAAGVGLMKLAAESAFVAGFLAAFFGLLILISCMGWRTALTGKSYYRHAVLTKTLVERELGLHEPLVSYERADFHLGIAVTPGQRDHQKILLEHEDRLQQRPAKWSVYDLIAWTYLSLIGIAIGGLMTSLVIAFAR